jgi:hypothetical protein
MNEPVVDGSIELGRTLRELQQQVGFVQEDCAGIRQILYVTALPKARPGTQLIEMSTLETAESGRSGH